MVHHHRAWARETDLAFETYTKGLAERLSICSNGLSVFPCEASPPTVPSVPDPALRELRPLPSH